jgi:hypothetical protein
MIEWSCEAAILTREQLEDKPTGVNAFLIIALPEGNIAGLLTVCGELENDNSCISEGKGGAWNLLRNVQLRLYPIWELRQ